MKSLVAANLGDREVRFRLLETTRAFALTKLAEQGEVDALGRQHAAFFRDLLETAENDSAVAYVPETDNIRAALTWAFAPGGDRSIAVALAAASAPLWLEMSLLTECHGWMEKALDLLDTADRGTRREMVLQTVLGISLMFTTGMSARARAALTRASKLAGGLREPDYQLRALACLATFCHRFEEFQAALAIGRQSQPIAEETADPVARSTVDGILGRSLFFLGEYALSSSYALRACRRITPEVRRAHIVRSGIDDPLFARSILAQILWRQGLLDRSAQTAREVLVDAEAGRHPLSLCVALVWCGCPISLRLGDLETAERSIALLKDHAERHDLRSYYACGLGFEGQLHAKRGDVATGERLLRACLDSLREAKYEVFYTPFLTGFAGVLAAAGQLDDSLAAAEEALQRLERNDGLWWMPEALRMKGKLVLLSDKPDATIAEDHFRRSLDMARRQGALSWELRTAMSLGRLHHAQSCVRDAHDLLNSVYFRFTEGFKTTDLQRARRLLEEWNLAGLGARVRSV